MLERRGDHLRLRGLEAAPGADHRGRRAADPRRTSPKPTAPARAPATVPGRRRRAQRRWISAGRWRPEPGVADRLASLALTPMADIGSTLREARMRARIDISEVEARDQDPRQVPARDRERGVGPAARARLRQELPAHLRRLPRPRQPDAVDEFKRRYERPSDHELAPDRPRSASASASAPSRGPLLPPWALIGARARRGRGRRSYIVGQPQRQRRRTPPAGAARQARRTTHTPSPPRARHATPAAPTTVTLQLVPDRQRVRVPGRRQRAAADPGPDLRPRADDPDRDRAEAAAHARQRAVQMKVNGKPVPVRAVRERRSGSR